MKHGFIWDRKYDEETTGRGTELTARFMSGVGSLYDLLRNGQVRADQDIHSRRILVMAHERHPEDLFEVSRVS